MVLFLFLALFFSNAIQAMEAPGALEFKPEMVVDRAESGRSGELAVLGTAATLARARTKWGILRDKKSMVAAVPVPSGHMRPCAACAAQEKPREAQVLTVWDIEEPAGESKEQACCDPVPYVMLQATKNEESGWENREPVPAGAFPLVRSQEAMSVSAVRRTSLASVAGSSSGSSGNGTPSDQGSGSSGFSEESHPFSFHGAAIPLNDDGTPLRLEGQALSLADARKILPLITDVCLDDIFAGTK